MLRSTVPHPASASGTTHRAVASNIVCTVDDEHLKIQAEALARELTLPFEMNPETRHGLRLVLTPDHLELRDTQDSPTGPVYVDFTGFDCRPYSPNLSRRQPLARALGRNTRSLVDATAGYCHDALLCALMGYRVIALERVAVVAALVRDGLQRFTRQTGIDLDERLRLMVGDARVLLPELDPRPDAIYLDPMYPPKRKKSAATKKEIRLLRQLVGSDSDATELLTISRRVALQRVVVKRANDAPPLGPHPDMTVKGKLVRYDIYLIPR